MRKAALVAGTWYSFDAEIRLSWPVSSRREELLVGPAGALVHDVEVAIEVGAEFEADAIALGEHESGIDGAPCIAVEALEHEFHAVRAFGHGAAEGGTLGEASAAARQSADASRIIDAPGVYRQLRANRRCRWG